MELRLKRDLPESQQGDEISRHIMIAQFIEVLNGCDYQIVRWVNEQFPAVLRSMRSYIDPYVDPIAAIMKWEGIPFISREEEAAIAKDYFEALEAGDRDRMHKTQTAFINIFNPIIVAIAKKCTRDEDDQKDCEQEGRLYLLQLLNKYKSYIDDMRFVTYAFPGLFVVMSRSSRGRKSGKNIRNYSPISRPAGMMEDGLQLIRGMESLHLDHRQIARVAKGLRCKPEEIQCRIEEGEGFSLGEIHQVLSFEADVASDMEAILSLLSLSRETDLLLDLVDSQPGPEEQAIQTAIREEIDKRVSELSKRQEFVLRQRVGLGPRYGHDKTLEEIGEMQGGLTREAIRQAEKRALGKMRLKSRTKILRDLLDGPE